MQTVVLAAGRGTRMRPLTDGMPKPLLPLGRRPLVEHVVDAAVAAGSSELVLVIGYGGGHVRDHFGSEYGAVPITYVEQDEQQGTGHALTTAASALEPDPFVVLNGDILFPPDAIGPLFDGDPAVGAARVSNPSAYGVLDTDAAGNMTGIVEKPSDPPSDLVNAGAYTFPAAALDRLDSLSTSPRGEIELTDLLESLITDHPFEVVRFEEWLDVGRPWDLLAATERVLSSLPDRRAGTVHEQSATVGSLYLEDGATIRSGVTIEGPVVIGAGATVGPNAYVRGPSVIGPNASVGHAVEIKASVLCAGATVGHQSYVGDSLLGPDVNFGAGTNVANLRHDDQPVRTTVKGERVSTGRRKYGVVVGPRVRTGIDTSLNAGVVLPTDTTTAPGETVLYSPTADDHSE